ncbi:MAG: (2Fe-2S)-binding protein [Pirellulales bacterium]|nr:(2Fe-2S)-binding protein [Pirellulales bacterium]
MELDDEVCLCFHVSKRKVLNFIRVQRPQRASQLSECFGAGTGCGWCRKALERYWQSARQASAAATPEPPAEPTASEHAQGRAAYIRAGHGTPPPGATPI